jgi:hypothetical protein
MGSFISKAKPSSKSPEKMSSEPIAMTHYAAAQKTFKPPLIANENAFLGDISTRYVPWEHCIHPTFSD